MRRGGCEAVRAVQFDDLKARRSPLSARPSMRSKLCHLLLPDELSSRGVFHRTKQSVPMSSRADPKPTCPMPSRRELTGLAKNTQCGRDDETRYPDTKRRCQRGTHLARA